MAVDPNWSAPTGFWSYNDWVQFNGGNELNSAQKASILMGGANKNQSAFQALGTPQPVTQAQRAEAAQGIVAGPVVNPQAALDAQQRAYDAYQQQQTAAASTPTFTVGGGSTSAPAPTNTSTATNTGARSPTVTTDGSGTRFYNGIRENVWNMLTPENQQAYLASGATSLNGYNSGIAASMLQGFTADSLNRSFDAVRAPQAPTQAQIDEARAGIVAGPVTGDAVQHLQDQYQQQLANAERLANGGAAPGASAAAPASGATGGGSSPRGNAATPGSGAGVGADGGTGGGSSGSAVGGGGLVSGNGFGYQAAQMRVTQGYNPVTREVDPNELVQNRVAGLIDENSPLMQRAAQRAREEAARRGLINSSISVGNAQGAVMDRAIQIGSQDAATYTNVLDRNLGFRNEAGQFNAQQDFERAQFDADATNQAAEVASEQEFELLSMNAEYDRRAELAEITAAIEDRQTLLEQGNWLQRNYVTDMGNLTSGYMNGWFNIQNSDLDPDMGVDGQSIWNEDGSRRTDANGNPILSQKEAALVDYNTTYMTSHNILNGAYTSMPDWDASWGISFETLDPFAEE